MAVHQPTPERLNDIPQQSGDEEDPHQLVPAQALGKRISALFRSAHSLHSRVSFLQALPHGAVNVGGQLSLAAARQALVVPGGVPGAHGVEHGGEVQPDQRKGDGGYDLPDQFRHQQHPCHQHGMDDEIGEVVYAGHQGGGQEPLARAGQQAAALLVPLDFGAHTLEKVVADAFHHGGYHHDGKEGQGVVARQGGEHQNQQHKGKAVGQDQRKGHHPSVAEFPPGDGVISGLRRPPQEGVDQQVQAQFIQGMHKLAHSLS